MSKPIIAVDIDEVLADYASEFVVMSNKIWGTNFTRDDYDENWLELWGVDLDEALARGQILLEDRMYERLQHNDSAADVLLKLADRYTLKILTSRNLKTKEVTIEWLRRHYPMFSPDDINFAGIWDNPTPDAVRLTKGDIAKKLGVQYIIDDQLKHVTAANERGISALLFGDYAWNRMNDLPKGITRVHNWHAVEKYFYGQFAR